MKEQLYEDTVFELQRLFKDNLDILTDYLEQHTLEIDEDLSSEENANKVFFEMLEEIAWVWSQ